MEFYRNFLFEYSLMGIVKTLFTRRNEIWCRILEIEDLSKNMRKTQDRASLNDFSCCIVQGLFCRICLLFSLLVCIVIFDFFCRLLSGGWCKHYGGALYTKEGWRNNPSMIYLCDQLSMLGVFFETILVNFDGVFIIQSFPKMVCCHMLYMHVTYIGISYNV